MKELSDYQIQGRTALRLSARFRQLCVMLLLCALCIGCGGSSGSSQPEAEPPPPEAEASQPAEPEPLFSLSFPPAMSFTESETIALAGRLREGVEASDVTASVGDREIALQLQANGEWRGELPLNEGENAISVTVTPTGESPQTNELAAVRRNLLLTFPTGLVVIGDLGYTNDAGLVEIDLSTGSGRRLGATVDFNAFDQLIGQTEGRLVVRKQGQIFLVDLVTGISESLLPIFGSPEFTPRLDSVAVDEATNTLYATALANSSPPFTSRIATISIADPPSSRQISFGADIGELGARSFLGFNARNRSLLFQTFSTSEQPEAVLLSINVDTGDRNERALTFEDNPLFITAAIPFQEELIVVDPAGQFFRIDDDTVSPVRLLTDPNDLASITAIALGNDQLIALDRGRGSLLRVDAETGETDTILTAAAGAGQRAAGWQGLASDPNGDLLLGITFVGIQSIDTQQGDRGDPILVNFLPISAGPNFIALPPLARAPILDPQSNSIYLALVSTVINNPTDFVRIDLTTGLSETVGSVTSSAAGSIFSVFPSVAIDPNAQLGWFFDLDEARSLTRVDLSNGSTTELTLSLADRDLLSVLADSANERLLFATTQAAAEGNTLQVYALDYDGGSPELLAELPVGVDATSIFNPPLQMALSADSNTLFLPLPTTQRIAVVDLLAGNGRVIGEPVPDDGLLRFSTGLSIAVGSDNRLFLASGEDRLNAVDAATGSQVLLSR